MKRSRVLRNADREEKDLLNLMSDQPTTECCPCKLKDIKVLNAMTLLIYIFETTTDWWKDNKSNKLKGAKVKAMHINTWTQYI